MAEHPSAAVTSFADANCKSLDLERNVSHFAAREGSVLQMRRRSSIGSAHAGHSNWVTAAGHLITAIIGAGVLGLPSSVAWMGWIGGVICLVFFFVVSLWCGLLLTDVYNVNGRRHERYKFAVYWIMGPKHSIILTIAQHANMILNGVAYTIAAAESMSYIASQICRLQGNTACFSNQIVMTVIFGGLQLIMSQLPNLESAWWASAIGAIMSLGYATLAIALGASEAHNGLGSLTGREATPLDKTFGVFNALGSIGFAYTSAIVLIEVEDTLREPPAAAVSMKKTLKLAVGVTFVLYMAVSICGYAALGDDVPGSILLGFANAPPVLTIVANFMVLIHMVSAYQVYSQPVFATIEDWILRLFPKADTLVVGREWVLRIIYRSLYVAMTTTVACALPFFSAFVGFVGAISFWPVAIFYPLEMWKTVYQPRGPRVWLMNVINVIMGLVAVAAIIGSAETIVISATKFKPFSSSS